VYIIIHIFILYLFLLSCYHFYSMYFLVLWLFKLLIRVPIRLVLLPPRVRSISIPNPRSDISLSEFASGHYPLRFESDEKHDRGYGKCKIRSDPFTSLSRAAAASRLHILISPWPIRSGTSGPGSVPSMKPQCCMPINSRACAS
jgi:hypothetical protein